MFRVYVLTVKNKRKKHTNFLSLSLSLSLSPVSFIIDIVGGVVFFWGEGGGRIFLNAYIYINCLVSCLMLFMLCTRTPLMLMDRYVVGF